MLGFVFVGMCFVGCLVDAAPQADRVLFLPGLEVQPTFNHYAGFLNASGTKKFFYWFIESERSSSTDPVVLWLNGGPGCSSLFGLLGEIGPWRPTTDGRRLVWFEHRWNKIANIIFMESPQCVGYSHTNEEQCISSDDQTAHDNHHALIDFFNKFPEFVTNEFFITGESYAGIYAPTLSARIVDDPNFNFKGFAVGNSVTDFSVMNNGYPYYAWGRGLLGTDLWNQLLDKCCMRRNSSNCVFYRSYNPACRRLYARVAKVQWHMGLNPYSVYTECYGGVPNANWIYSETEHEAVVMLPEGLRMDQEELKRHQEFISQLSETKNITVRIPCSYTDNLETYLNRPDVRAALHVPRSVQNWLPCSIINFKYKKQYDHVRNEYAKILAKGHRILGYYGDWDMVCDHLSGMWFFESLGQTVETPFKEWFYPDSLGYNQIAGFVIQWPNMTYVSIKGAGHSVPADKPLSAFIMFEKFLNDEPY